LFTPVAKPRDKTGFWASLGYGLLHLATAAGNFFWWKDADDLKQRAFYVDYLGEIIDPASITVDDYEKASGCVKMFEKEISELMRQIKSASPKELNLLFDGLDFTKIDQLRKQAYDLEKRCKNSKVKTARFR